jgi:hypothetical protein
MAGHGVGLQERHAVDHVLALAGVGPQRALPGVAAVEEEHLVAALGAHALDDGGEPVEPADAAVGLCQRRKVFRGQRVSCRRLRRNAETLEEVAAGEMRRLSPRRADAEIDRRLAEIDRQQLAVNVGDMQQCDIAERVEFQQFGFAQPLLRHRTRKAAARRQRRGGGADLQQFATSDHRVKTF